MARLQILELPEGSGDDRPPFVLVVDEVATGPNGELLIKSSDFEGVAEKIGARAILSFEETIDIPANDVPLYENGQPLFFKVHLEAEAEQFRQQVQDEIRKAQADFKRAIEDAKLRAASDNGWTGRPTHPDGTPYGYAEITAEGWESCEGCRTWGQWTINNPHDCPSTYIKGPIAKPTRDA
jgi:hypothetical protein